MGRQRTFAAINLRGGDVGFRVALDLAAAVQNASQRPDVIESRQ
jgi:hypothetical protein